MCSRLSLKRKTSQFMTSFNDVYGNCTANIIKPGPVVVVFTQGEVYSRNLEYFLRSEGFFVLQLSTVDSLLEILCRLLGGTENRIALIVGSPFLKELSELKKKVSPYYYHRLSIFIVEEEGRTKASNDFLYEDRDLQIVTCEPSAMLAELNGETN